VTAKAGAGLRTRTADVAVRIREDCRVPHHRGKRGRNDVSSAAGDRI
jgi:hypothetical protein